MDFCEGNDREENVSAKHLIKAQRQEKEIKYFFLLQNLKDKEAHPLLGIDVYLGIKELITVIIFP